MKKLLAMTLSSMMLLTSLVGCAGGDTGTASTTGGSTSSSGGGSSSSSGSDTTNNDVEVSEGDIVLGIIANTTGSAAQYGVAVSQGAKLYIDQVNEEGGINGKELIVFEYDDQGDGSQINMLFERMVNDGATAVIGSVLTGTTTVLAYATNEVNMPQITASATAATVTVDEETGEVRENVFRACFIDPFQGEKMADYASEVLGASTAAIIYDSGSDYSVGLKDAFEARCAEIGVELLAVEGYATGDTAFQAQLTTIGGQTPDVIFAPNYYEDVGLIVTQARQAGVTATFLGGDGWAGVSDYASAEDLEGSVFCSGFAGDETFEADFEATYGTSAGMFEALGYDAALVLVAAIEEVEAAGGLTAGTDEYKQAVIDAMSATKGLQGITGTFEFDENNDPIKSASMMVLTDGVETFTVQF